MSAGAVLLVAFAATMGFDLPSVPGSVHAAWADALLAAAIAATTWSAVRGRLRTPRSVALGAAVAYAAVTASCAFAYPGGTARVTLAAGAVEMAAIAVAAAAWIAAPGGERVRDAVLRAWIGGALVLGVVGLGAGAAALLGRPVAGLHGGEGELGWAFRPAGLQRVGALAELCVLPLLVSIADGRRLLGRGGRALAVAVLGLVLLAGATRCALGALLGLVLLKVEGRRARAAAAALVIAVIVAARLDVHETGAPGIRWRIAADALRTVRRWPLTGAPTYEAISTAGWPRPDSPAGDWTAHCAPLDVATRSGVPAALLFVLIFALVARATRPAGSAVDRALWAGVWALGLDALHTDLERFRDVWLLFGLVIGASQGLARRCSAPSER